MKIEKVFTNVLNFIPNTIIIQKRAIKLPCVHKRSFGLPREALDTCFLTPRFALPLTNVSQKEGIYKRNFSLLCEALDTLFLTPRFSNANK